VLNFTKKKKKKKKKIQEKGKNPQSAYKIISPQARRRTGERNQNQGKTKKVAKMAQRGKHSQAKGQLLT